MIYDLIILGGGPAGVAAGIYAARKKIKCLLISEHLGGQSTVSAVIENWIGEIKMSGFDLLKKLENHLRAQEGIEIVTGEKILAVKKEGEIFSVTTDKNNYQTKTVVVATGAQHRQLGVPGEEKFNGKGVAYCSTCDAPLFKNKDVVVVGSGNSGLEAVVDLLPYANKIYLLEILEKIQGDPVLAENISGSEKVELLLQAKIKSLEGDQFVEKIIYENLASGEVMELPMQGVFVEIGMAPNSTCIKDLVELNPKGEIKIDHQKMTTSVPGIFAAGDVTDVLFKQSSVAAGDGVKAALAACAYTGNKDIKK